MLRARGGYGLASSMHGVSARVGASQPMFSPPLAAGGAMEQLRKEADALVLRHQTSQRDLEQLRADLAKHQAEGSDLKAQLAQVKQENAGLCGCLRDGEQKFESLQCKVQMTEVMHSSLRDKVNDLASCGNQAENNRIALEASFDKRFKSCEGMMCKITSIHSEHLRLTKHIDELKARLATANVKKTELKEHLAAQQAELQEKQERLKELSRKQGHLEQKMQQDILAFEQQLASVHAQLKQKEGELREAADRFSKLQSDSEARTTQLSTDLQTAQHSIELLQADAEKAAQLHNADEREKCAAREDAERLQQSIADARGQAMDLEAKLLEAQDAHKSQVAELQDQKDKLEADLSTLKAELAELTSNLDERDAALIKAQEQAAEAAANVERMQKQVADATANAEEERKRAQIAANKEIDEYKERINETINGIKADAELKVAALQQQLKAGEQEWAEKLAALEAKHQSAFTALQDNSSAEKEQLQKEVSQLRDLAEARLKSLEEAQAAATLQGETLGEKVTSLTAELEAAKASHEQEAARLKSEAETAQKSALEELQKEHNDHLSKAVHDLASEREKLDSATTKIADLQMDVENMDTELHKSMKQTQKLEKVLAQTQENLAEKEEKLADIGKKALSSSSPSDKKRASPTGMQKRQSPPAYTEQVFEEEEEEASEEEEPQPKRRGRRMPSRFHQAHGEKALQRMHQQTQYDHDDESQEDDASSDGTATRVHKQQSKGIAAHCLFTEPPMMDSQQRRGGGRRTVFGNMSACTHTDLEEDVDVSRRTMYRRKAPTTEPRHGGGTLSGASLLKHKGGTEKKRKAARGGPHGSKRGPSSAINLFGNTDPYAFAPSPA